MTELEKSARQALEALEGVEALLSSMDVMHLLIYGEVDKAITALRRALEQQPTTTENNGGKTGWPPGLLQDDNSRLSKWFASKPDARQKVREALEQQPADEHVAVMTVLHLKDRTEIGYGPYSAGYDLPTGEYKLYTRPQPALEQQPALSHPKTENKAQTSNHAGSVSHQPADEPVAWRYRSVSPFVGKDGTYKVSDKWSLIHRPELRDAHSAMCGMEAEPLYTTPPAAQPAEFVCSTGLCHYRKPLTDDAIYAAAEVAWRAGWAACRDADLVGEEAEDEAWGYQGATVAQDTEAKLKEKNT